MDSPLTFRIWIFIEIIIFNENNIRYFKLRKKESESELIYSLLVLITLHVFKPTRHAMWNLNMHDILNFTDLGHEPSAFSTLETFFSLLKIEIYFSRKRMIFFVDN